tara:strand:- start:4713 stop:5069 length:357 start_codon:yes stop_codon:yes gene_type:complete
MDINRIVKKVLNEEIEPLNEGIKDIWSGIKGTYQGYGYKYTKNLSALRDVVGDLSYSEKFIQQVRKKCDNIIDDTVNSKMPDNKKDHLIDIANDIIISIDRYNHEIKGISDDVRKVLE